jgi:RNA polymerase sigma-70 factor (ECF subfamily)
LNEEFTRFYSATVAQLRGYLSRVLGDADAARDLAQDAYLRMMPALDAKRVDQPKAFLYTTARRLAFDELKRRRKAPLQTADITVLHSVASSEPGVVRTVMARQELERVQAAIAGLPPGCRAVLILCKIEMLPHTEVATRLGISVSTVEKQHARALRLIQAALDADEEATDNSTSSRGSVS